MYPGKAALMIHGICMDRYSEEAFKELERELELEELKVLDPEKAQDMLNRQGMD